MKKAKPRNKFEKNTYSQLSRAKVHFKYEEEKIPYILARQYIPDYILDKPIGKMYIECKGYFRPEDKAKLRAVKKQHPELDIRLLFYRENKQYIRWCIKHGFPCAVGTVPKEWLHECIRTKRSLEQS